MLLDFLVGVGVPRDSIFCSSLPGNDINEKISSEVKTALKNSTINIAILSKDYYESAFCLNEAGIMWYVDGVPTIPLALPEINPNNMYGFLNSEYKLRTLSDNNDIAYIYDMISEANILPQIKMSVLTCETKKLITRYQNYLTTRTITPRISSSEDVLCEITTDDERIILYFILSKNIRKVSKSVVIEWLHQNEIYDINIDNAFDLLSTLNHGTVSNETLELDINTFRKYSMQSALIIDTLKSYLKNHINLSADKFQMLWDSDFFNEHLQLFIAYIIEEKVCSFGARWMAESQVEIIKQWENKNSLDSELSENYGSCLESFIQNNLVYESSWTSYGNPREYTLCSSLQKVLFSRDNRYSDEVYKAKNAHHFDLPF